MCQCKEQNYATENKKNRGSEIESLFLEITTVFPRINAAAFIKFFMIWVRRLFEGGVYSRAAFI